MKLTCIFLLAFGMQLSAKTAAQTVTFAGKDVSLEKVFSAIREQTGYVFFYSYSVLDLAKPVSLREKNAPLAEVLALCFKNQPLTYSVEDKTIVVTLRAAAPDSARSATPDRVIHGRVAGEKKEPLGSASVVLKGTTKGTTTNANGEFSISASTGDVLVISLIGYATKEVTVGAENNMTISLSLKATDIQQSVVITALGIKKSREMVSYATQEVKGEALQTAPEPNIASNLVGKVAGLDVYTKSTMFEDPNIYLRGGTALVVLDGVATDPNSFNFWSLDPNNIDNITVLKGTAAAALYGADGKNGAIMITTKTGKAGANGTEVSFNSTTQAEAGYLKLPKTQTQYGMGWDGYYAFTDGNGGGGWYDNYGYVWGPKLNQKDPSTPSGYVEVPQYNSPYNPNELYTFTESGSTGQSHYKPIPLITRGANNLKNFLNQELTTTDNLSASGKSDYGDFRISLTNAYQKGQVPNTALNSTTLNLSGSLKVTRKLQVQAILSYNRQNSSNYPANATNNGTQGGASPSDYFYDIMLWMGPDVNINDLRNYWQPSGPNPRGGSAAYGTKNVQQFTYNYSWYNNPWFVAYQNLNAYTNNVINAQLNATYNVTHNLNFLVRSAVSTNNANSSDKEPWSLFDNSFDAQLQGGYFLNQQSNFQIVSDALLTYKTGFLKDFHATVSAGATTRYNEATTLSEGTVGGLTLPDYYSLQASVQPASSSNYQAERQSSGLMGYADLDYKNELYLGLTGRNDWVSDLQKPHNSYFYPSANLGIVVSKLIHLPTAISYFKLRGAWAQVQDNNLVLYNNIYQDWYATLPVYTNGARWGSSASLNLPGTLISPALSPNKTVSQEYGTELDFLKNRIGLDVTYYEYAYKDFPVSAPLSSASGYDATYVNGGEQDRKGLEVVLKGSPVRSRDFNWDVNVNWDESHVYQKSYYGGFDIENGIKTGQRIDAMFNTAWEKNPQGQVIYDASGNPLRTPYAQKLGYTDPDWSFGLSNTLSYKSFSLKFSFDGRVGGVLYDGVEAQMYDGGNHPATANSYRDDAYAGNSTYLPKGVVLTAGSGPTYDPLDGHVISDDGKYTTNTTKVNYIDWVRNYYRGGGGYDAETYNRTFVKLREVIVSYNLSPKLIGRTIFKAGSISLTGRNLFLWTKVPFLDPDGYNGFALPEPSYRNIGLNVNLKL